MLQSQLQKISRRCCSLTTRVATTCTTRTRNFCIAGEPKKRVAIVGAGPAGFYTSKYVMAGMAGAHVDMFDMLPTPFGLVRSGVAPDHPEVKLVQNDFAKVATDPRFSFHGNVKLGRDLQLDDLKAAFDAVVLSYGASSDRALGVQGEGLPGVHSARAFVNWYNGHPDYAEAAFDLSQEHAIIVGNGNVAMDVARVLTSPLEMLARTDITQHALDALAGSKVRHVHLVARRGPAQAAFTIKELRELTKLPGCRLVLAPGSLDLNEASAEEIKAARALKRKLDLLKTVAGEADGAEPASKHIHFHFLLSPSRLLPGAGGALAQAVFARTALSGPAGAQKCREVEGEEVTMPAGLLFKSIGYKSEAVPGVAFDARRAVVPSEEGRVQGESNVYVAGWLKRGPTGIIGTNITCARETTATMLADLEKQDDSAEPKPGFAALGLSVSGGVVDWQGWERIEKVEDAEGAKVGKPREKITHMDELLKVGRT